jgi:chromosomal replication initiator protein
VSQDAVSLWGQTLRVLEKELLKTSFSSWLKYTKPVALYKDTMIVSLPNDFSREWVESKYAALLKKTVSQLAGTEISLQFVSASAEASPAPADSRAPSGHPSSLNSRYVFDTFVVGNSNRFAHAAALAVAEMPARAYNPLFIYGGVGLGKTHLMHAIGHHALLHHPSLRVRYVSSESFTNELIDSIRDDRMVQFRNRYRNVDVLLIDDIQFIAGKERTQEEFFHTFEALHGASKQVVISSDRPPKDILTLEERLRSRFEWGLISDIQAPDLETRIAILRKRAQAGSLDIPDEVIQHIAFRIETNIRELEGALIRVVAFSDSMHCPISIESTVMALRDIVRDNASQQLSIPVIQKVVADFFNVSVEDLKIKRRTRVITFPRQVAMYLCRELTKASYPILGEEFGGRDHTTVIHAYEKIAAEMQEDPALRSTVEELTVRLKRP